MEALVTKYNRYLIGEPEIPVEISHVDIWKSRHPYRVYPNFKMLMDMHRRGAGLTYGDTPLCPIHDYHTDRCLKRLCATTELEFRGQCITMQVCIIEHLHRPIKFSHTFIQYNILSLVYIITLSILFFMSFLNYYINSIEKQC